MTAIKMSSSKTGTSNALWLAGSFIPNGTGAISTQYGRGFSVARADEGVYTITLDQPFADFISVTVTEQFATADTDTHTVRVGDIDVANKTFQIVHLASADTETDTPVAADISASTTANKINFLCVVALSDVPGAGV